MRRMRERSIENNERSRRRAARIYRRTSAATLIRMGTLFASTCASKTTGYLYLINDVVTVLHIIKECRRAPPFVAKGKKKRERRGEKRTSKVHALRRRGGRKYL